MLIKNQALINQPSSSTCFFLIGCFLERTQNSVIFFYHKFSAYPPDTLYKTNTIIQCPTVVFTLRVVDSSMKYSYPLATVTIQWVIVPHYPPYIFGNPMGGPGLMLHPVQVIEVLYNRNPPLNDKEIAEKSE